MNRDALPLQQLCETAIGAAREAGRYIQSVDRTRLRRGIKDAGSSAASRLVTEVDIRSEAIIREHLEAAGEQWNIAFVGEEAASGGDGRNEERFSRPYFWCVDPLDGTLPYAEGSPGYAVSIALVAQSGVPLIGVVYDPVDAVVVHAVRGQGAYRDLLPLAGGAAPSPSLVVLADGSFRTQDTRDAMVGVLHACARDSGLDGIDLVYGSGAVKNACQVLDYPAACYVKLPKPEEGGGSIWDFAATACIVEEAGGWVSDIHGQALRLNPRESMFMNRRGVVYASSAALAARLVELSAPLT